jgi:hypothetical protein
MQANLHVQGMWREKSISKYRRSKPWSGFGFVVCRDDAYASCNCDAGVYLDLQPFFASLMGFSKRVVGFVAGWIRTL